MTSIVEVIQHYQRSIDSSQENEARLLHCINKLYKLPIKVEHLQETGIGKTVNSLRKFNGEIGVAAKTLVTKWKAMVAAEEEPMETTSQENEHDTHNDANGDGSGATTHEDEDDENHNRNTTIQKHEDINDKHNQKNRTHSSSSGNGHKDSSSRHSTSTSLDHQNIEKASKNSNEKHKSSSSDKSKSSGSSERKDKEREKEKKEHKSSRDRHKERDHNKEKERHDKNRDEKSKSVKEKKDESQNSSPSPQFKSSSHTNSSKSKHEDKHSHSSSSKDKERSSKHKSSSRDKERLKEENHAVHSSLSKEAPKSSSTSLSSKSATKEQNNTERKRRRNSDNESVEFKSPQPKAAKLQKSSSPPVEAEEEGVDDSFDSSMGANFDDVLGMLNMPVKRSKKSLKSPSTPLSNSTSATKKDTNIHRQTTSSSSSSSSSSIISNKINDTRMTLTSNSSTSYAMPTTSKTMKPDLLAPSAKLEPLDPSIVLELPTISTNYKPMPLNQTVMDCVFNNSASTSKPVRTLTDAEAITHGISSKTMRTKIYSGVRTGQTFQVQTLFDMCIRLLQKNIDALEYTGGVPFEVLRPVLERATPQQLYVFEEYNPYLMEDSDVLWQQHVSRNYRTKKRIENESWKEMFVRCQEEEERKLSVLKDSIKASQKIAAAPVRKTQLAFVDSMVKPPRNVIKKQEQFGTKAQLVATPAARVASLSSVTPNAAKMGDQRLKVSAAVRDNAQVSSSAIRPKKAPLMQKTLQFIRGRHKR